MSVFGPYARYYDLLYRDKDYGAEAADVLRRIRARKPDARRLLELGSGTGLHAIELARAGCDVTGIELSEAMLASARRRVEALSADLKARLRFHRDDARRARLGARFDAAVALFHVASYQAGDGDLDAALGTVAAHLEPGGPFVFDFWYAPAVLAQRPEARTKRVEDEAIEIVREAKPVLREAARCVEVRFDVRIRDKRGGADEVFAETHTMRYFSLPEIEAAAARAGLRIVTADELLTGAAPSEKTWAVCATLEKR
jgi:SAM-dependent methyltransferase